MLTHRLPDLPSALLAVALDDLERAEQSKDYRIDMGVWHEPNSNYNGDIQPNLPCSVCFAGSVMAFSLSVDRLAEVRPLHFDPDTHNKLIALDDIRAGLLENYLWRVTGEYHPRRVDDLAHRIKDELPSYRLYPDIFKSTLRQLAKDLQERGL